MDGAALISTAGWTYILKGDTESGRHDHPCACFSASDWLSAKSNFQGTRPRIAITRHAFKGRTSIGTNKEARRGCSSASGFASWGALTYVRRRPLSAALVCTLPACTFPVRSPPIVTALRALPELTHPPSFPRRLPPRSIADTG